METKTTWAERHETLVDVAIWVLAIFAAPMILIAVGAALSN